jgi:hypothetical protein
MFQKEWNIHFKSTSPKNKTISPKNEFKKPQVYYYKNHPNIYLNILLINFKIIL